MTLTSDDRWEINDLYARYAFGWDDADGQAFAAVFTPDGVFHRPEDPPLVGRAEIAAFVAERAQIQPGIRHFTTNIVIEGDQDDTARGTAYVIALRIADDNVRIRAVGRYHDLLRRLDEGWRIADRKLELWLPRDLWDIPIMLDPAGSLPA
jgi:uncharacterized protein (TIGR02246 family)